MKDSGSTRPRRSLLVLTADEVREIRICAAAGDTFVDIAAAYGVSATQVGRIVRRQAWKEVRDAQ